MIQRIVGPRAVGPAGMRWLFNLWPPFRGAGIRVRVWDKAGAVRFLKPARGTVTARFVLPEERIAEARDKTASGEKHEPRFTVAIVDEQGVTVAEVDKTLYIRRKRP